MVSRLPSIRGLTLHIYLLLVPVVLFLVLQVPKNAHALARVDIIPNPTTINEGASQIFTVTLNEPIICENPNVVCQVEENITSSDPSRITINQSPIIFPADQWYTHMTFNVTALSNTTCNDNETNTLTLTTTSNSEYYSGFTQTVPISIVDKTPLSDCTAPMVPNQALSTTANHSVATNVISGITNNPDPASLAITSDPTHGTATTSDGTIIYSPNNNYVGPDSLAYKVCSLYSPSLCSHATIAFTVTAATVATAAPDTGYGARSTSAQLGIVTLSLSLGGTGLALGAYLRRKSGSPK